MGAWDGVACGARVSTQKEKKSRLTYSTLMKTELLFVVVACAADFPSTGVDEVGVQWVQAAVFVETLRRTG